MVTPVVPEDEPETPETPESTGRPVTPQDAQDLSPTGDVDEYLPVDEAVVVDDSEAVRGGRSTNEDTELVPFAELMKRLQADRSASEGEGPEHDESPRQDG